MPVLDRFTIFMRAGRSLRVGAVVLGMLPALAGAATFTVSTTADGGPGSLRSAIESSNATAGPNAIVFNVSGALPLTITPASPLPALTVPVTIDGTTQPGFAGVPVIELNGALAGATASGLHLVGGNCTIRGLVINRFLDSGIWVELGGGNVIEGNYVGTDVTGLLGRGNAYEGIILENGSSNNRVGGLTAAARNVICDNKQTGIFVRDGSVNNQILGNYVGVAANGTQALGNSIAGVLIKTANNLVGGLVPAARNVISSNGWSGIYVYTVTATGNLILGNYVGTDATGLLPLGNVDRGIAILDGSGNTVGGVVPGARNLISGNLQSGLLIDGLSMNTVVRGNYIGCDVSGTLGLGNGIDGIEIRSARNNFIGGSAPGAGNVVSGNQQSGISIFESPASGNVVQGNFIGTQADGVSALGNLQYGVFVFYSATQNLIGGAGSGEGNVIAHNCASNIGFDAVRLHYSAGPENRVAGNSISTNHGSLAIDIGINGVTPNDPADADGLPNFPLLACAASSGGKTFVYGTLSSSANQTFTVELFSNAAATPVGYGPGERPHGSTLVTTDATGQGSFAIVCPTASLAGAFLSATATNATNSTSEFSASVAASSVDSDGDGLPNVFEAAFALNPNDPGDAAKDADGDGASNRQEFLAGTNPGHPGSVLRIAQVARNASGVTVTFPTVAGIIYRVESTANLLSSWGAIAGTITGTGGVVSATVALSPATSPVFFRVVTVP